MKAFEKATVVRLVERAKETRIPAHIAEATAYVAKVCGVSYDLAATILKKQHGLAFADRSAIGARMIVEVDNSHIACRPLGPTMVPNTAIAVAFT